MYHHTQLVLDALFDCTTSQLNSYSTVSHGPVFKVMDPGSDFHSGLCISLVHLGIHLTKTAPPPENVPCCRSAHPSRKTDDSTKSKKCLFNCIQQSNNATVEMILCYLTDRHLPAEQMFI